MSDDSNSTVRDADGRFVKGQSGNPAGKPVGAKNQITVLRTNTELALREYLDSPAKRKKALSVMDRLFTIAEEGSDKEAIQAMRLIFDKILPNARGSDEADARDRRPVAIQIINHTGGQESPVKVIDGEATEIK